MTKQALNNLSTLASRGLSLSLIWRGFSRDYYVQWQDGSAGYAASKCIRHELQSHYQDNAVADSWISDPTSERPDLVHPANEYPAR